MTTEQIGALPGSAFPGLQATIAPSSADGGSVSDPARARTRLQQATQEFEAVFIGMLLKQMRKTMTGGSTLLGNSHEAKLYQDFMDDAVAEKLSQTGSFGLAKVLYKSMEHSLPYDPSDLIRQSLALSTRR